MFISKVVRIGETLKTKFIYRMSKKSLTLPAALHCAMVCPWKMRIWKKVSRSRIRSGWIELVSSRTGSGGPYNNISAVIYIVNLPHN